MKVLARNLLNLKLRDLEYLFFIFFFLLSTRLYLFCNQNYCFFLALCMITAMSIFTKDYRDGKIRYDFKDTSSMGNFMLGWGFNLGWLGCTLFMVDLFITCELGCIYWRSSFETDPGKKAGLESPAIPLPQILSKNIY